MSKGFYNDWKGYDTTAKCTRCLTERNNDGLVYPTPEAATAKTGGKCIDVAYCNRALGIAVMSEVEERMLKGALSNMTRAMMEGHRIQAGEGCCSEPDDAFAKLPELDSGLRVIRRIQSTWDRAPAEYVHARAPFETEE
jgi:hypothetical protein